MQHRLKVALPQVLLEARESPVGPFLLLDGKVQLVDTEPLGEFDEGEDRFFTNWDVVGKKFTLSLQFADEDLRKNTPAPGSSGGKHRADLRYDMKY